MRYKEISQFHMNKNQSVTFGGSPLLGLSKSWKASSRHLVIFCPYKERRRSFVFIGETVSSLSLPRVLHSIELQERYLLAVYWSSTRVDALLWQEIQGGSPSKSPCHFIVSEPGPIMLTKVYLSCHWTPRAIESEREKEMHRLRFMAPLWRMENDTWARGS